MTTKAWAVLKPRNKTRTISESNLAPRLPGLPIIQSDGTAPKHYIREKLSNLGASDKHLWTMMQKMNLSAGIPPLSAAIAKEAEKAVTKNIAPNKYSKLPVAHAQRTSRQRLSVEQDQKPMESVTEQGIVTSSNTCDMNAGPNLIHRKERPAVQKATRLKLFLVLKHRHLSQCWT